MIAKEQFTKQKFITQNITEESEERMIWRVPNNGREVPRPDSLLREKIRDIVYHEIDKHEAKNHTRVSIENYVTDQCDIPYDTFKKYIGNNKKYKISRTFIAKIAVGLKLEIDIANELFLMHSGELNLTNNFDYITYYALESKDDIAYFKRELREYTGIDLDKYHG